MAALPRPRELDLGTDDDGKPIEVKPIDTDVELQDLDDRKMYDRSDKFDVQLCPAVKGESLQTHLSTKNPHLLHFCCHGSKDGTLLLKEGWFNIGRIVGHNCGELHGVFVNACDSISLKDALLENGAGFVVVCNRKVGDEAAKVFAGQFYTQLFIGRSLYDAFEAGRLQLSDVAGLARHAETMELHIDRPRMQALIDRQAACATEAFSGLSTTFAASGLTQEQHQQLNFLRFATLLIDDVSDSLRELFVHLWNKRYTEHRWGAPSNRASGMACWDGSELDIDSGVRVRCIDNNKNLQSSTTVAGELRAPQKNQKGEKVRLGTQAEASIVMNIARHNGSSKITVNKFKPFASEATIYTQLIKHETKATPQMARPFAQKVLAGDTREWDISLLVFLLCNSSHALLDPENEKDKECLDHLSGLRTTLASATRILAPSRTPTTPTTLVSFVRSLNTAPTRS
jgi:hypothetical protein